MFDLTTKSRIATAEVIHFLEHFDIRINRTLHEHQTLWPCRPPIIDTSAAGHQAPAKLVTTIPITRRPPPAARPSSETSQSPMLGHYPSHSGGPSPSASVGRHEATRRPPRRRPCTILRQRKRPGAAQYVNQADRPGGPLFTSG